MAAWVMVMDEASLGLVYGHQPWRFWPLASAIGGPDWKNGSVPAGALRPALQADFDRYRVCSKGFLS